MTARYPRLSVSWTMPLAVWPGLKTPAWKGQNPLEATPTLVTFDQVRGLLELLFRHQ